MYWTAFFFVQGSRARLSLQTGVGLVPLKITPPSLGGGWRRSTAAALRFKEIY